MHNNYTGVYKLDLDGKVYDLKFNWRALGELKSVYPDMGVQQMLQSMNPFIIADMIVAGTNGAVTKEALLDMDIPVLPVVEILDKAITAAYLGNTAEVKGAKAESDKKKTK